MPIIKTKHEDIVTTEEWQQILALAAKLDFTRAYQVPPFQLWLQCVLAIVWLTGKRINEILQIKRKHISFERKQIKILFFVGKKKGRKLPLEQLPYQKTKTVRHKAVPYIRAYLNEYDEQVFDKEAYLFPAKTEDRTRTIKTKYRDKEGKLQVGVYEYSWKGGYVTQETARFWLNKINEQLPENRRIWFHFGRHTVGTKEARKGKSPYAIAEILDCSVRAALEYTKRVGGYAQEWTNETE